MNVLPDDRHRFGLGDQPVNRMADRTLDRVVDRNHRPVSESGTDCLDHPGDGSAWDRIEIGRREAARPYSVFAEGSGRAEVGDSQSCLLEGDGVGRLVVVENLFA